MKLDRYLPKSFKKLHGSDRVVALGLTGFAIAAGATFLLRRVQGAKQSPGSRVSGAFTEIATKLGMPIGTDMDVATAQRYLNQIANASLEVTGTLDAPTATALRAFQHGNGIPETGAIDEETGNALQYMAAATSKNPQMQKMANVSPYLVAPPVTYTPMAMPQPVTYSPSPMPQPPQPVTYAPANMPPLTPATSSTQQATTTATTTPAASTSAQPGYFTQLVAQNPQLGPPFTKTLKMSIKGAQRALNDLTNANLPLTGKLDHATIAALQNFQNEQGLHATGHISAETANALLYLAGTQNPSRASAYHHLARGSAVVGVQSTNLYDPRFHYSF